MCLECYGKIGGRFNGSIYFQFVVVSLPLIQTQKTEKKKNREEKEERGERREKVKINKKIFN